MTHRAVAGPATRFAGLLAAWLLAFGATATAAQDLPVAAEAPAPEPPEASIDHPPNWQRSSTASRRPSSATRICPV